ncbi:MAG: HAD family hydrolase [Promethearchaeota archaeon]
MSREEKLIKLLQNGSLRGIIFDFDGTLLDIREILEKSIEEVFTEKKLNIDMDTTIQEIGALLETIQGYPMPKILLESYDIFKHITALKDFTYFKKLRMAIKIFAKYLQLSKEATLFPGVKDLLKKLSKSFDLYIVSHNKTDTIIEHLKNDGVENFFKGVYGSDKIPVQKPDPMALQPPLENYDKRYREEFLMVGDMPSDITAGREAGMWTLGVASGVSKKDILIEYKPDLLIGSLEVLLQLIEKL